MMMPTPKTVDDMLNDAKAGKTLTPGELEVLTEYYLSLCIPANDDDMHS